MRVHRLGVHPDHATLAPIDAGPAAARRALPVLG